MRILSLLLALALASGACAADDSNTLSSSGSSAAGASDEAGTSSTSEGRAEDRDTSTTTPAAAAREGSVSQAANPPGGENCRGLRSRTAWASTGTPDEIGAAAGGSVAYVETVTNEGTETCTRIFERCPAPGELYTAKGERAPWTSWACTAEGRVPVDLAPGQAHQDEFTIELFTKPGDYELRVPQHDGRIATLPIRLEPLVPSCEPGTLTFNQQPFEVFVFANDTTFSQTSVDAGQQSCTIRIAVTRLTLRPEGDLAAPERTFVDETQRWYTNDPSPTYSPTYLEATYGPIDLPPGQYEGAVAIQLESGETLRRPARLLVG